MKSKYLLEIYEAHFQKTNVARGCGRMSFADLIGESGFSADSPVKPANDEYL